MKELKMKLLVLLLSITTAVSLNAGDFNFPEDTVVKMDLLPSFSEILDYFSKSKEAEVEKQLEAIKPEDPSEFAVQPRTSLDADSLKKITQYITLRNVGYFVVSCGGVYIGYKVWLGYKQWLLEKEMTALSDKIDAREQKDQELQTQIDGLAGLVKDNTQQTQQLFQKIGAARGLLGSFNTTLGPVQAAFLAFPGQINAIQKMLPDTVGMLESARLVLVRQAKQFAGPTEEIRKLSETIEANKNTASGKLSLLTKTIESDTQALEALLRMLKDLNVEGEEIKAYFSNIKNIGVENSKEQREFIAAVTQEVLRQLTNN